MEEKFIIKNRWVDPYSIDHESPMRKVINVYQNDRGYVEELECGHDFLNSGKYLPAKKRRCKECRRRNHD